MSDEPTKLINKKGIAYQCMTCGKVDQRHRLKTHIYKEHIERGNVPYLCSLCSFFGDTYASLANHLVHEVHSNNISLYGGDSHNTNSFVHCAGEAAEYLQEGNHYVAFSQEKSEEIWRKRTRGSGGDGSGAGTSGVSPSPVEEFPTLQDLISLEDPDVPPLWGSADLPEESATETVTIPDPSAITVTVLTDQSSALPGPSTAPVAEPVSLPGSPSCDAASSASSHSIECEDVVKALHEVRDAARAVVGLGEVVRDTFLTFNNIMTTQNKILDKLNQNIEKMSRRNISDERGGETQEISV